MDKETIIRYLNKLADAHPNLFQKMGNEELLQIRGEWISKLSKYTETELMDAIECYPFPRLTQYNSRVLDGIIQTIEDERHRDEAVERYKKSVERMKNVKL